MSDQLAMLGGSPVLNDALPVYRAMGGDEVDAVANVVRSGCLSGFGGAPGPGFMGGEQVLAFEAAWKRRYECGHAISVNSATTGLFAAVGAVGIGPGDEIIVPPYTMSATAIAPLFYGAIPVFAEIETDSFCLDPVAVEAAVTPSTR